MSVKNCPYSSHRIHFSRKYLRTSLSKFTSNSRGSFFFPEICCYIDDQLGFYLFVCLFLARQLPQWARASSFTRFLDHTQWRITVGRNPLDEWSARRRDLYLTTHNIHNRQTSMTPVGFEITISAGERPQTYALDRAATGIGTSYLYGARIINIVLKSLPRDNDSRPCLRI